MRPHSIFGVVRCLSILLLLACHAAAQQPAVDLILTNGKVFTSDPARPSAEAIAIKGDRIVAAGTNAEVKALAGKTTRRIDLGGRVVVPGFNDAHTHFMPDPSGYTLQFDSQQPGQPPDPAWAEVLKAVEAAAKQVPPGTWIFGQVGPNVVLNPEADRFALDRVRIEHGDGLTGGLVTRARNLGTVVVLNPVHFVLSQLMFSRYGPQTDSLQFRSLINAGVPVAIGSDGATNPFLNIMFATIHPARPAEAITRGQAVEAYTRGSAYAEFQEGEKGAITSGKLADLTVLSQDIFTARPDELPVTRSLLTIVGGRVVYDAGAFK